MVARSEVGEKKTLTRIVKRFTQLLIILCTLAVLLKTALAGDYSYATVTYPGSTSTIVYGINKGGQSAGAENSGGTWNGFASTAGILSSFNPGSASGVYAEGINDSGQIVGLNLASGNGFLLSQGAFTAIVVPGSDSGTTNAIGINDAGQMIFSYQENGALYGFLLSGGAYTAIAVPGAASTVACGINNNGQIIGWYVANGETSGFSLSGGVYTTTAYPGAASTQALGLNDSGEIVGQYSRECRIPALCSKAAISPASTFPMRAAPRRAESTMRDRSSAHMSAAEQPSAFPRRRKMWLSRLRRIH
jgi:hypothetical protein